MGCSRTPNQADLWPVIESFVMVMRGVLRKNLCATSRTGWALSCTIKKPMSDQGMNHDHTNGTVSTRTTKKSRSTL